MLATIIDMQIDNKPYSITLVPLPSYQSPGNAPISITVPNNQLDFVRDKFACGDTIEWTEDIKHNTLLREPVSVNNPQGGNYDNMLVETVKNTVDKDGIKYAEVRLFGEKFGCPTIKMYTNAYTICPGNEVLVWKTSDDSFSIVRNFSIEERRKNFLNKNR